MKRNILKILSFLSENGFLQIQDQKIKSFDTLGLFVRENIKDQLKKFYKQNDKFSFFLSNNLEDVKHFVTTFSKLDSLINSFAMLYKQRPGVKSDLILSKINETDQNNQINPVSYFSDAIHFDQLSSSTQCLALFCNKEQSLNYFHWLQSQRHRFWRKLAANPSNFRMTNVNVGENNCQNLGIIYNNQDGLNLDLEKISYFKTLNHLNFKGLNDKLKDYLNKMDLIICETNLDLGTLGLLYDSHNFRDGKSFMSLNEHLTPYQFAITVISSNRNLENRSKELISFFFDYSKNTDLKIYPFINFNDKDNLLFDNYDKIGVLYTILIQNDELEEGFLSLRNRDTNIIEKFHVNQLKSYLSLYAKLN